MKKRTVRKAKKSDRRALLKDAQKIFNEYIRLRDENTCVTCGTQQRPTCSHLISTTKKSVTFSEINCHCQCAPCNFRHEYHPEYYTQWFIRKFGFEMYDVLVSMSKKTYQYKAYELQALIDEYKGKVKQLKQTQ